MMGHRHVEQAALFYEFSLERRVPPDHLLRSIDRYVELDEVRGEPAGFDLLPNLPSFIRRVCSSFAPPWGVLRTRLV